MYKAIRGIGVEHVTLSSDRGEPLFPNSVEGMRQMCAYMRAFGLSQDEIKTVSCDNPARILGRPSLRREHGFNAWLFRQNSSRARSAD